jgi:hypothetical protein
MKTLKTIALVVAISMTGCSNVFDSLSNKNTDDAIYEAGVIALNNSDFDTAVTKFSSLNASYFTAEEKKLNVAGAYAGRCGLNFASYAVNLGSVNMGADTIFQFLMKQWTQISINPTDCQTAEDWINAISPLTTGRSATANFDMMILAMAKIGMYVRANADVDGAGDLGDGTADAGFDVCSSVAPAPPVAHGMPDADVDSVVSGFANFLVNATASLSVLSSDLQTAVAAMNATCGVLTVNPCTMTDAATVTAPGRAAMRDLLDTMAAGVGTCVNMDPNTCC